LKIVPILLVVCLFVYSCIRVFVYSCIRVFVYWCINSLLVVKLFGLKIVPILLVVFE